MERRISRKVSLKNKVLGGGERILIQSMTNTDTADFEATMLQINTLAAAGCDVVRFTVPDMDSVRNIYKYKCACPDIALVADIHFDYKLALEAAAAGIDKIRINPGNIGSADRVKAVASACRERNIPIRIGVNGGSLEKELLHKYGSPCPEALAESAMGQARILEGFDFNDIVLSVKTSTVPDMIRANEIIAAQSDYPLHLGVTEAGTLKRGLIKSSIGIGALLARGIGDTIRVSLTADVCEEVEAAKVILSSLGLSSGGIEIVSCPTCGRTKIDIISIANELEKRIASFKTDKNIKVAVMGCAVNGPGEAREADVGIAGGKGEALLFKKGVPVMKIDEASVIDRLVEEIVEIL